MIIVNGKTYHGNCITVNNNNIIIDGVNVTPDGKEINITVDGNINELKVDVANNIKITGNVTNIQTKSGDVDVSGNVTGSIQTTSGDVDCGTVGGSIKTMSGDIKHRKHD